MLSPIEGATRLAGVIGDPVAHSLSPRMQNAAFRALGLDWVYLPLHVRPRDLRRAVAGLPALGFSGANVTIPHKRAVVELCEEIDEVARRAGSVNTLVVDRERIRGSSTDGLAVVSLVDVEGADALVAGAGGAALAAAAALLEAGAARVSVASRTADRAGAVVAHLRAVFPAAEVQTAPWPPSGEGASLVVHATPLKDELPFEPLPHQQVVDLAYRADGRPTALVAAAHAAGCPVVADGLEVLVRQGAASFERWTGEPAPLEAMRAAVRAR